MPLALPAKRCVGSHRDRVHCAGDRHLCSRSAGWRSDRACLGSRLPRGDPEPADPIGRARGSRTVCAAKWLVHVTSPRWALLVRRSAMTGYPALSRGAPPWQRPASGTAPAGDAGLRLRPCTTLSSDTLGDERRQPSGRWYDRLPRKPAKPLINRASGFAANESVPLITILISRPDRRSRTGTDRSSISSSFTPCDGVASRSNSAQSRSRRRWMSSWSTFTSILRPSTQHGMQKVEVSQA